jgi:hypothetical protein
MQPGDKIIATAFGNKKIKRIFVQRIDNTCFICKIEEWEAAIAEKRHPIGVGFPFYDVRPLSE